MASDHSGIVQQIEQVIATWRLEAAEAHVVDRTLASQGKWEHGSGARQEVSTLTRCADQLSAVLVSLPAPEDQKTECCHVTLRAGERFCPKCGWEARAEADTRCTVCREEYPAGGQQVRSPWEVCGKGFRVCRRCRAAGKDAKRAALSLGLVNATPVKADDLLLKDYAEARVYLERLFLKLAPQCRLQMSLAGVATQIDNYIAGLHQTIERLSAAPAAVNATPAEADPIRGLREAKYLNPTCASDGCQWLRAAPAASVPASPEPERQRLIATLTRLAATQRNLPVPLTEDERTDLRAATQVLASVPATQPEPRKCPHDCRPCQLKEQLQDSLARIQAHTASPSAEREKEQK